MTKLAALPKPTQLTLLLLLGLFSPIACRTVRSDRIIRQPDGTVLEQPSLPNKQEEQSAQLLWDQYQTLLQQQQVTQAEQKRSALLKQYPATLAATLAWRSLAKEAVQQGHLSTAIESLEKLLFYRPDAPNSGEARKQYARLLMVAQRHQDALPVLVALMANTNTSGEEGQQIAQWLLTTCLQTQQEQQALALAVQMLQSSNRQEQQQFWREQAETIVNTSLPLAQCEQALEQSKSDGHWAFLQPRLLMRLARLAYHVRNYERAETLLQTLLQQSNHPFVTDAKTMLTMLKARFATDSKAIGIVLPLSGKFQQFGERALWAIQLSFPAKHPFKLIVKDSQGEPSIAAEQVEALVLQHHVIAIIGPLFSGEAQAAAYKAEEFAVPLLTLSHKEGLADIGPWIFRTGLTVAAQAKALAKVAFEQLGFRQFALLYPKSRFGQEFVQAFWSEVDERQGEIRGAELYDMGQTTFREQVRRLIGKWDLLSRPDYKKSVEELRAQKLNPMRMRSELEKLEKNIPPLVDFEAIVIPDVGAQLGLIAPALAFEDVVLVQEEKMLEKMRKAMPNVAIQPVRLLGASSWNSAQTIDRCDQTCEDAIFVDAFFAGSTDVRVRDFVTTFKQLASGSDPTVSEALAYDTGLLLQKALHKKTTTRSLLQQELFQLKGMRGITGTMQFTANGELERELFALTIHHRQIELYQTPLSN